MTQRHVVAAAAAAALFALAVSYHLVSSPRAAPLTSISHPFADDLLASINATVSSALDAAIQRSRAPAPVAAAPPPAAAAAATSAQAPVLALPPTERALRDAQLRVNYSEIFMSAIEVDVVLRHLIGFVPQTVKDPSKPPPPQTAPRPVRTYLEWGSGGSTTNFAQFATVRAYSIEHTAEWCDRMRPKIAAHPALTRVRYRCVGLPFGNSAEGTYEKYRPYVDEIAKLDESTFDFVLVDGRARVSCAIKALSFITSRSVVVLHDSRRVNDPPGQSYAPVLKYYDAIDSVGGVKRQGLFVLRRKRQFDKLEGRHADVQRILNEKTNQF